ncbi:hypothetical protein ACJ4V0_19570 [Phreatobacter sp. HK31-P]
MNNRFDNSPLNKDMPGPAPKQQEQAAGDGKRQGGLPHEVGGRGQAEQQQSRDDDAYIESQPGGQRDDLMDKANQRNPRSTDI